MTTFTLLPPWLANLLYYATPCLSAMCPSRREVVTGIGGIVTGTIAVSALSSKSKATQIQVQDLNVPDTTEGVSSPVTSAQLAVQGEYSVNAEVVPTRVICRLEAKRATNESYTQLAAEEPGQTLTKEFSEPFEFQGNLLDCPEITAPTLTPAETGETTQIDVDVRIRLQVKREGKLLKEVSVEDTVTLTTEKTLGEVSIGLEATGNVSVSD